MVEPAFSFSSSPSFCASSLMTTFTNVSRAWLWGLPVARARSRARRTRDRESFTRWPSTVSHWARGGTFWRSATARATTSTMCSPDFQRVTQGSGSTVPWTPG